MEKKNFFLYGLAAGGAGAFLIQDFHHITDLAWSDRPQTVIEQYKMPAMAHGGDWSSSVDPLRVPWEIANVTTSAFVSTGIAQYPFRPG